MEFRTLAADEGDALLALLDGWDVGDGWRAADFFRRYQEGDPTFDPAQVEVAVEGSKLRSCVQVFPRRVRLRGAEVPCGGIGSVYTDPGFRKQGLSEQLLARATESMRVRGMPISLLFAIRIPWYTKLGWASYPQERVVLRGPVQGGISGEPFDAVRDLASVRDLHATYGAQPMSVVRDGALWKASLRNAGNPDERFRVVRAGGTVSAYLRTTTLQGMPSLLEMGRRPGDAAAFEAMVALVAGEMGTLLVAPSLHFEPRLLPALTDLGARWQRVQDPTPMLRCLDAPALANRLGETLEPGESPEGFLARMLPAEGFTFWTADRF